MNQNQERVTDKQLKYLNILLVQAFGKENRKTYLKLFCKVNSSKILSKDMASDVIGKFVSENPDRELNIASAMEKILEVSGQTKLFPKTE